MTGPIPHSYWVVPGRLVAGEYAGPHLERLLEAGVDTFFDLTEEGEYGLPEYRSLLPTGIGYRRFPTADFSCASDEAMAEVLDALERELRDGCVVYVHCYGGIGRTGTVIGCHLVRQGLAGQDALDRIAELRAELPNAYRRSPETEEQRQLVLRWRAD